MNSVGGKASRSTYYRWRQGQNESKRRVRPWNRVTPNEERRILAVAREFPELSSRQLSAWITDNEGFAISESTVYRILRREGLVKRQEIQAEAAKEYHTRTTRPHQMWATDASYFRVVGWGYYYNLPFTKGDVPFSPVYVSPFRKGEIKVILLP